MSTARSVSATILQRFSCRTYADVPLSEQDRASLDEQARALVAGPLGTALRFRLAAATEESADALKGLGTYGFVRGARGFLVGAVSAGDHSLEDYGHAMEQLVLCATGLGLGTCWLGGSFTRGSFARAVQVTGQERVPAVVAVGRIPDAAPGGRDARDGFIRRRVGADLRLPWESLFFDGTFAVPLSRREAGAYAEPLEMLRKGPSASNKQPWRVLRAGGRDGMGAAWHLYLQRTPGYRGGLAGRLLRLEDIQRVDMGIAMCHFELTARELGLRGKWVDRPPQTACPASCEYVITWEEPG